MFFPAFVVLGLRVACQVHNSGLRKTRFKIPENATAVESLRIKFGRTIYLAEIRKSYYNAIFFFVFLRCGGIATTFLLVTVQCC